MSYDCMGNKLKLELSIELHSRHGVGLDDLAKVVISLYNSHVQLRISRLTRS